MNCQNRNNCLADFALGELSLDKMKTAFMGMPALSRNGPTKLVFWISLSAAAIAKYCHCAVLPFQAMAQFVMVPHNQIDYHLSV